MIQAVFALCTGIYAVSKTLAFQSAVTVSLYIITPVSLVPFEINNS